jgi:hypothetical protein
MERGVFQAFRKVGAMLKPIIKSSYVYINQVLR